MKIAYYADTDTLYIGLAVRASSESQEVTPGLVIDYDGNGGVVGIEIEHAGERFDLDELTLKRVPAGQRQSPV